MPRETLSNPSRLERHRFVEVVARHIGDAFGIDPAVDEVRHNEEMGFLYLNLQVGGRNLCVEIFHAAQAEDARASSCTNAYYALVRALSTLDFVRAWRAVDTYAPPASLVVTNRLGRAAIDHYGVDPQEIVNAIWDHARMPRHYSEARWATDVAPGLVGRCPEAQDHHVVRIGGLVTPGHPWLAGSATWKRIEINTFVDPGGRLAFRIPREYAFEARIAGQMPETVAVGLRGRRLSEVISHGALDRFELPVAKVTNQKGRLDLTLKGREPCYWAAMVDGGVATDVDENATFRQHDPTFSK